MADTEREDDLAHARHRLEALHLPEMIVRCWDCEWKIHYFILNMYSCFEEILEVESDMAQEKPVELDADEDPATVHRMLTWMYISNYDDEPAVSHVMQPHLARALINIDVYCIAENFDIASLQEKAIVKILAQSWSMWTMNEFNILFKKIDSEIPNSIGKKLISDCAGQVPGLLVKEDGTCAIRDIGKFASDRCQELKIQKRDQKIARLEQQVLESKWNAIILQVQLNEVKIERDIAVGQLDRAVRATVEEDDCEECGAAFGAYLSPPPLSNLPLVLSCKRCQKNSLSLLCEDDWSLKPE